MPQVTVYIRNEDLDKWAGVEKKSEFLHNALNPKYGTLKELVDSGQAEVKEFQMTGLPDLIKPVKTPNDVADAFKLADKDGFTDTTYKHKKVIKTPKDAEKALTDAINVNNQTKGMKLSQLCKIHGTPLDSRGKCLQKGCKYS